MSPAAGRNPAFTKDSLTQLIGGERRKFDPAFERGADHQGAIKILNDPPRSTWVKKFVSDQMGVRRTWAGTAFYTTYLGQR